MSTSVFLTRPARWILLLLLVSLAYLNRFTQDDAFISFRYADNLVHGHGLVWNVGERVEGYTNFLWTLLMAVPIGLGIDPVVFSHALGLVLIAGTLTVTYALTRLVVGSGWAPLLALGLLGTNYTFSSYATGGLETQLQTLLIVSSAYVALSIVGRDDWRWSPLVSLSLLGGLALLTRVDSVLILAVLFGLVGWRLLRAPNSLRVRLGHLVALAAPGLAMVLSWLTWKTLYYGSLLPNTAYVKAGSAVSPRLGLSYLFEFVDSYLLFPIVFLLIFYLKELSTRVGTGAFLAIAALWGAYIIKVGGDFMEFRFLVPVLPFLFILFAYLIMRMPDHRVRAALVLMIITGSVSHAVRFHEAPTGVESISILEQHLTDPDQDWIGIGRLLGELCSESSTGVVIATTAAGAIPYYSNVQTIDMHGLNDHWLARNGPRKEGPVGHQTYAPYAYMLERGTNLLIGHPRVERIGVGAQDVYTLEDIAGLGVVDIREQTLPEAARMVRIPLNEHFELVSLYLQPDDRIDQLIAGGRIRTFPIVQP